MDKTSISVKQVSKSFKLPHEKHHGLKQAVINFRPRKKYEVQHVLKDISFEIKKGEFFGIVGRNGSGKSTLLKLLAQIYTPDTGAISVNGTLTPFIELGVGFNPELTGRENVYMNGALLGFDRKQTDRMYDDIVHFAELEKFMDQKLKNYSSGMQVRLAFSIAIRSKSDILLVDEVLAVGDEAFQKKCTKIFETYKATDKTVVLVTHDMSAVERFCDRAMLIHDGRAIEVGDPRRIAKLYSASNTEDYYQGEKAALKKEMARYRYFLQPRRHFTPKRRVRVRQQHLQAERSGQRPPYSYLRGEAGYRPWQL
jgi:ABC-2 type transport system ATP-binding protein